MIYVIYELFSFCNASLKSLFYDGETNIIQLLQRIPQEPVL